MRIVLALLLLAGCATPRLTVTTPSGGIVAGQGNVYGLQQAFLLAEQHCRQFGKTVRVIPYQTSQDATSFTCEGLPPGRAG